jgi:hypothetical protein
MLVLAVAGTGCAAALHRAAAPAKPARPSNSLQRQLQLYVARAFARPRVPAHPRVITLNVQPQGSSCFVATRGGPCSLTPCIVEAQGAVLQRAISVPFVARSGAGAALRLPEAGGRCPAGARTSQVLRVSGP